MEDRELVQRAREGDRYAFNLLIWRWERPIYNLALRIVGSEEDATEVCQEVFIKAYTHLKDFRGDARFSTWLYRIAINCCHNILRQRKRRREIPLQPHLISSSFLLDANRRDAIEQDYQKIQLFTQVMEALQSLPEEQRAVVELRILHDLGVDEVAQILGIPPGTVKSRLFYALKKLRERLQPLEQTPPSTPTQSTTEERPV